MRRELSSYLDLDESFDFFLDSFFFLSFLRLIDG